MGFKKFKKKVDRGHTLGRRSANICGGPQLYCDFLRKKSSLGAILIVQLCIFSCEYKTMVGYNVLQMYLRAIGLYLVFKRYVKKSQKVVHISARGGARVCDFYCYFTLGVIDLGDSEIVSIVISLLS